MLCGVSRGHTCKTSNDFEFNHSLLISSAMIGELVGEAIIFPKDMKIEDLWNEVLVTNPLIDSFTICRVVIVS